MVLSQAGDLWFHDPHLALHRGTILGGEWENNGEDLSKSENYYARTTAET
jgi:hypothetical protein